MMISSPAAGDPYAAAAALDRSLRADNSIPGDSSSDSATPDSGPDVIVTLGTASPSSSTYDASGKLPSAPKTGDTNDTGFDAPDSLSQATESDGDDATAAGAAAAAPSASSQDASADVDQDATATA